MRTEANTKIDIFMIDLFQHSNQIKDGENEVLSKFTFFQG